MALAFGMSLGIDFFGRFELKLNGDVLAFIRTIHFNQALMMWMLSFLLFAGALTVNLAEFCHHRSRIIAQ
ncbi:MAG: hypothetical protein LV481_09485 [Methylacidiphilales bacterium]|nr:hypothetical protein [Candidatus Methylacidiphilales bacterium]